jgi:hypothetical protein
MQTGVVYIKIRLELEQDIDEDEVQELVQNLDYIIKDPEKDRIQNTEIVACSGSALERL